MSVRILAQTLLVALKLFPADISRVRIGQQNGPLLLSNLVSMDSALRILVRVSATSAECASVAGIVQDL
jgi:hypothetical protein